MKSGEYLLLTIAVLVLAIIPADIFYASRLVPRFKELEKQRIITSNQLATAKIVSENLNHVRDLVYRNMEFAGQKDSVTQEYLLFDFLTSCVNDLKMRLISVRPALPTVLGRVTTYGYDIQLEGDFFSLGEFCSKLENSRRILALTTFEVSQIDKEPALAREIKGGKGSALATRSSNRGVSITLHLNTFRVKKGG